MTKHTLPFRIYYEDTDAGAIVYYANYLKYAERGRTELLRERGVSCSALHDQCGILIVVKAVEIDYKRPARLDDSLHLVSSVLEIGGSSMKLEQTVWREEDEICRMKIVLVCISAETMRPVRWPIAVTDKITTI